MEKSPITRAHAHVSKAQKILSTQSGPTPEHLHAAAKEHNAAADLFEEAVSITQDPEAARTLELLVKQHRHRAAALTSLAERSVLTAEEKEKEKEKEKDKDKEKESTTTTTTSPAPTPEPRHPPTLRTSRTPDLASNLASARGIPPPTRSPPPQQQQQSAAHFLSTVDTLMNLLRTPLAAPLAFAGQPLSPPPPNSNQRESERLASLMPKGVSLPADAGRMGRSTAGINESFYVVPPTGGTVPYSEMVRRGTAVEGSAPLAGSAYYSFDSDTGSALFSNPTSTTSDLEAEVRRLQDALRESQRIANEASLKASMAEKEVGRYKERWDQLKSNAKAKQASRGKVKLESVKE